MTARVIDGKTIAGVLRANIATRVTMLPYRPGLAVVLVGEDPASIAYVRNKDKVATQTGIDTITSWMPDRTSQAALLDRIETLNEDPAVDGILVQFPLPSHIDPIAIVEALAPAKDVDGFHPANVGRLVSGRPGLVPCTPMGVMRLLAHSEASIAGTKALV